MASHRIEKTWKDRLARVLLLGLAPALHPK
jgi:hypothetical protein